MTISFLRLRFLNLNLSNAKNRNGITNTIIFQKITTPKDFGVALKKWLQKITKPIKLLGIIFSR